MGLLNVMRLRMALLAIVTVALTATGWAHRVPEASAEAQAFMAATGATADDLCGDVGGDRHADPLCQACQIAGGLDLPSPAGAVMPLDLQVAETGLRPLSTIAIVRVLDLSHAPQGPPVV